MPAGVVQQTNNMTIDIKTITNIRSSGLCRDFLLDKEIQSWKYVKMEKLTLSLWGESNDLLLEGNQ